LPQQDPGPAHPDFSPGAEPQQAVSPGPGKPDLGLPDTLAWAAMSFSRFLLPQWVQAGSSSLEIMRISQV